MTASHPVPAVSPVAAPPPDSRRWPGLGEPAVSPIHARVAEAVLRRAVRDLDVRVELPGGISWGAGGPGSPVMLVHRPDSLFRRLGRDATIGFGEAYMVGDWTSSELADLLTPFAARLADLVAKPLQVLRPWVLARAPRDQANSIDGARRNIAHHYDLSNDLFAAFLDETMTYSSAWFTDLDDPAEPLADAQRGKIDKVLDAAGVRSGQRVLEIGTGWGELAIRAAGRGALVTSVTLSREQRDLARRRVEAAGLTDLIRIELCDYREVVGSYDAIVSVEMIEAVGLRYWAEYFASLDRLLRPGGRVGLQTITIAHHRMLATRNNYTWIHKYVFPGGQIPSLRAIEAALARRSRLRIVQTCGFGRHYARTLAQWRSRFLQAWPELAERGFDATFRRMWEFYLAYCEAGFRSGYLDVHQLELSR
jgi:cyclopropane-fatty-acyl-phospholipid synthase